MSSSRSTGKCRRSVIVLLAAAVMASWIAPSSTVAQVPTTADSLDAAIRYGRSLEDENIVLRGKLRVARADSIYQARLYALGIADRDRQMEWLEDQLPRWYEKPAVIVPLAVLVTVWATLQIVQLSI